MHSAKEFQLGIIFLYLPTTQQAGPAHYAGHRQVEGNSEKK